MSLHASACERLFVCLGPAEGELVGKILAVKRKPAAGISAKLRQMWPHQTAKDQIDGIDAIS